MIKNDVASSKIEEFESIRGVAALLVVLYHLPHWNAFSGTSIVENGYLMVHLFFVLSGFVICNAYATRIERGSDLLRFQFLRFGRLYPVHLIFLLVFLLIEVAKYLAQARLGIVSPNSAPFHDNNTWAFIQHLLLISSVLPNENNTFNYPAWSISVEFYTYLIFGLIILYANRIKEIVFALIVVITITLMLSNLSFGFDKLLRCLAGFFIGCLTAQLVKKVSLVLPHYIAIVIFCLLVLFLQFKTPKEFDMGIYFLTSALIFSLLMSRRGILNRILSFKVFTWLGTISYSVYMSHASIIWVVNQVLRFLLKLPEIVVSDGTSTPQLRGMEAWICYPAIIICVLFVSQITYSFVEKPLRIRSRQIVFGKND